MAKRTFADIKAARKKYDPKTDGYGTPSQWTQAFSERMGFEEAERVKAEAQKKGTWRSEYAVLGVTPSAAWDEIKAAFRKSALNTHPDRAAANNMTDAEAKEKFQEVQAAFAILERRYGK